MPNRLSFSQINKYEFCAVSWDLHYNKRIRPTSIPSPLIFGSAIGKTFEYILKGNLGAQEFFDEHWTFQEVNGVMTNLKESKDVVYLKSDFDEELGTTPWESLRTKAHCMITAFQEQFLPLVEKVYSTEEEVLLTSGEDSNIGFADAVVKLKGYDKPVVIDFKTAGRKYEPDSVRESVQLSQYLYTLGDKYGTDLAGYIVFLKTLKKNRKKICKVCGFESSSRFQTCNNAKSEEDQTRCNGEWTETIHPSAEIQILIDTISQDFQEKVVDNIGKVNDNINSGEIIPNYNNCENDGFGRRCQYYNLCHNSSMEGLIQLEEKK
jgi:hypothetical protein